MLNVNISPLCNIMIILFCVIKPRHQKTGVPRRNHRIKRMVPCRCLDGHVKEPYEMSMAWEPDRRSNFSFFSPPAHLCAVTCMTEILLIVTLNNQFTSLIKGVKELAAGEKIYVFAFLYFMVGI